MYFQLKKLILWPRDNKPPRIVEFKPGSVNVISGASKTGKSAVIPIIDYCLGADKCAIPVGVIRENCSWFGVLIDTLEGQKLLARREPEEQQKTGDMFLIEAPTIDIPQAIEDKNTNVIHVKAMLNRLASLTSLAFEPENENSYKSRPSFRDLMAFTFQPQNIVANPDIMFFKADTTEHREKLKTIFPYILGAVTAEVLQARFELDRLWRMLRRKEAELKVLQSTTTVWKLESQSWIRQAIEFGLLSSDTIISEDWDTTIDMLRQVVKSNSKLAKPSLSGIDVSLKRLETLRNEETEVATKLSEHRQRLNELRRLLESSEAYGGAMRIQRDRLSIANWFKELVIDTHDPIANLSHGKEQLLQLCSTLEGIEAQLRSHPSMSDTLDKEVFRQRGAAEVALSRLNEIRVEIASLEAHSDKASQLMERYDRTERFLGRLEQALQLYDRTDQSSALRQEIADLKTQIEDLQRKVSEAEIRNKLRNALNNIEIMANRLVPQLDAEWPDAPIKLIIEDLTVKILRGVRDDYLWEIGSGANWLAYHVSLTLALQKYFLAETYHPVPGLLIYDQPSQVYFPKRTSQKGAEEVIEWKDQDIIAVRKVFDLFGRETLAANGRLQIIVLDHAHEDVWGDLPGVTLIEEWRDKALVPSEWLKK